MGHKQRLIAAVPVCIVALFGTGAMFAWWGGR